ncbi:hypothetical protein B7494_g5000 [Chlorociboria aeruginascens]|nr:hypothetical protein B7494_g5000 [Chlorociboria aeruginascens]
MVRFFESNYTYYYSFPAVTLAYFLRYPNPYSTHVLSTDVISRSIDPDTGRLFTLRLHRKASRVPSGVKKFLPKSALESMSGDSSDTFVLETSEVDIKEGWMRTESRNLDWTSILSVVEKQEYRREAPRDAGDDFSVAAGKTEVVASVNIRLWKHDCILSDEDFITSRYSPNEEPEPDLDEVPALDLYEDLRDFINPYHARGG